jgi:hypothetical protein
MVRSRAGALKWWLEVGAGTGIGGQVISDSDLRQPVIEATGNQERGLCRRETLWRALGKPPQQVDVGGVA